MVGIILLKDIQTGSYAYTKVVVFNGSNYSEINYEKPFSEYTINIKKQKIVSKNISSNVEVTYFQLVSLLEKAHDFLFLNPHAVCLQFKISQTDTEFRIIPSKQGSFCLPDLYNFAYGNAVYFPLKTFTFKTQNGQIRANPLEADVCCVLLNYALQSLGNKSDVLYYQAGGTLYVNLCCIIKNRFLRRHLKSTLSSKTYKLALKLYKENDSKKISALFGNLKAGNFVTDFEATPAQTEYEALINKSRAAKLSTSVVAAAYFSNVNSETLVKNIFNIINDEKFIEIKNGYYEKILSYGRRLFLYKHIPKKDYLNYLMVYDIISSEFDIRLRKTLSLKSNLLRYTATDFENRENFIIASDGTAYEI